MSIAKQMKTCFVVISFSISLNRDFEHIPTKKHSQSLENNISVDRLCVLDNSGEIGLFLFLGCNPRNGYRNNISVYHKTVLWLGRITYARKQRFMINW